MEDYKKLYEQTQRRMKEFIKRWDGIKLSSNDLFTEELKQIVEIESEDDRIRKALISVLTSDFEKDTTIDGITVEEIVAWLEKQTEQKPAEWIGTDMMYLENIIALIDAKEYPEYKEWLICLRNRYLPQPKQEWSEEDSYYRNHIIQIIEEINNAPLKRKEDWESYINWLKSITPQSNITDEELAQAKKDAYNDALDKIEYHGGEPTFDDGWNAAIDYIRKKSLRPQNRWKPIGEQISCLARAINRCPSRTDEKILGELLKQLNKQVSE